MGTKIKIEDIAAQNVEDKNANGFMWRNELQHHTLDRTMVNSFVTELIIQRHTEKVCI